MGVFEDSPLRNPDQIPFLNLAPLIQNPSNVDGEEETPSMKELVQEIDSHVKLVDLEVTSKLRAGNHPKGTQIQLPTTVQPTKDITRQQAKDVALLSPTNPSA